MDTYDLRLARNCYYVCLGIIAVSAIACLILHVLDIAPTEVIDSPCVWITFLGVYCPGCGGTRAVEALLRGELLHSFLYHPLVLYTVVLVTVYVISHTLNIISKGRVRAMLFRGIYLYLMIAIILVQWIAKNILKLVFCIELC